MEWYTTESGKYRVESLSAETFPGALKVIQEAFCQDEAVSIGSEVNKDPAAQEELLELCADAALDGVSLVAIEVSSSEVVAVAFNKLQVQSPEKTFFDVFVEERCNRPSSKSLIQFMSNVDARCNLFEKHQADCSLEIMFLATFREHRKQNLGTILCKLSVDLARKLKNGPVSKITLKDLGSKYSHMKPREVTNKVPKICQAIWTGEFTQRIGSKLGFNVEVKALMSEFNHNGKTYADRLGDQAAYSEVVSLVLD